MKPDDLFSVHEKRLLRDFLYRRPKYLGTVNAAIDAAALVFLIGLFPDSFAQLGVAVLSGILMGVYFEQCHIDALRAIFKKASVDILAGDDT